MVGRGNGIIELPSLKIKRWFSGENCFSSFFRY
uniref:Uncharacterized protein n=1 Tax=Siphoviridae sp. ctuUw41 TaxID=2826503 RepID=A0A8S5MYX5_9CAUD|nr:MAG TPA: hypothetical protein [Siphoviridae sp. ctuUw41]